jgi:hypothetical protein
VALPRNSAFGSIPPFIFAPLCRTNRLISLSLIYSFANTMRHRVWFLRIWSSILSDGSPSRWALKELGRSFFTDMTVFKFVAHSYRVLRIAAKFGWLPGARYTNLRDVKRFERLGFLDIDWRNYDFAQHLSAAKATMPSLTVARDVERVRDLPRTLDQAFELLQYSSQVIIVPKARALEGSLEDRIPKLFLLGDSVPSRYGDTPIAPTVFKRPVHLLGGRPDTQKLLASQLKVFSIDCNRFTLDAAYGDYFDGERFRPHPVGGYDRCIRDSIRNMNALWDHKDPKDVTHSR